MQTESHVFYFLSKPSWYRRKQEEWDKDRLKSKSDKEVIVFISSINLQINMSKKI